ncbi:MAG: GNAT family N-acetyltransferase, partial [bacterium]
MAHALTFRPLAKSDCELVAQWRAAPHVERWFGPCGSHNELLASYFAYVTGEVPKRGHVVLRKDRPIGFVESYRIDDRPQYFANLGVTQPGSVGMDLFIGTPDDLGQ